MINMIQEKTVGKSFSCTGVGVHTGAPVSLSINPAPAGHGIKWQRTDAASSLTINAKWDQVSETRFSTTISNSNGFTVQTIEHLMAALAACEIDNALIKIHGSEVPIMDGSAVPFITLIQQAGITEQKKSRKFIRILKKVRVEHKNSWAMLTPNPYGGSFAMHYEFTLRNQSKLQVYKTADAIKECITDLASARTFGFLEDAAPLQDMGFALGASLDNTVVFDGETVLNNEGLRFVDECVRHKALDVIGDLYLAGHPIIGCFSGKHSGHQLNNQLLRAVMSDPSAWRLEELSLSESENLSSPYFTAVAS